MSKLCKDKFQHCPFFPITDIKPEDITTDEFGVKHRKFPRRFKCLFDNRPLEWNRECPREDKEEKIDEPEQDD